MSAEALESEQEETNDGARPGRHAPHAKAKRPFEFGGRHDAVFERLGWRMKVVGVLQVVFAVIVAAVFLVKVAPLASPSVLLAFATAALVPALGGAWTLRAGTRFALIADTRGRDLEHLLVALEALSGVYTLQLALFVVSILTAAIAGLSALGA